MTVVEFALLLLLGAALFLDQWPALQTMASRPIVAGPLVGLVLGSPLEGALWGAAFEAMYLAVLPVGAARCPDVALATIAGTAVALAGREGDLHPAGLAVTLAFLAGRAGEWADGEQRRRNGRAAEWVRRRVAEGDLGAPGRATGLALARGAALGGLQTGLAVAAGLAALELLGGTPWLGVLPERAVAASALAAAAVGGARIFAPFERAETRRAGAAAWLSGIALGTALAGWAVAA